MKKITLKKILVIFAFIFIGSSTIAQTTTYIDDDFNDVDISSGTVELATTFGQFNYSAFIAAGGVGGTFNGDYTNASAAQKTNAVSIFSRSGSTKYVAASVGSQQSLRIAGGANFITADAGVYFTGLDLTGHVTLNFSFQVRANQDLTDADIQATHPSWKIHLNHGNTDTNFLLDDDEFVAGANVTRDIPFTITRADNSTTTNQTSFDMIVDEWITISGSIDLTGKTLGSFGALQIETDTGGFVSGGKIIFFLDNASVSGVQAPKIDVTPGDFSTFNTSASGQTGIFDRATVAGNIANFTNTANDKFDNIYSTTTSVPRLAFDAGGNILIPAYEGYKFTVSNTYNPITVSKITYKVASGRNTHGEDENRVADESRWIIQGSNDDTNWDNLCEEFGIFSTTSDRALPLNTTKPYRYYRFVLAQPWRPISQFTALLQIEFETASVWEGNTNTNWGLASNYEPALVPPADIIIPSGLTQYPTIPTGSTITNNITIESGASLVTEGTATVSGTVNFKRRLTSQAGDTNGWYLVGTPIASQTINENFIKDNKIASGNGNNLGIATYNNGVASNNWIYTQGPAASATGTISTAKGYSMKVSSSKDVIFTGSLNTTDPTLAPITVGAGTPFNLIANPFASHINSETFLDLAANSTKLTSKTIWVWNSTNKNYDTKMSTDAFMLAPGQGFFISATSAGNLEFAKSNQAHLVANTFQKSATLPKVTLNITNGTLNRYAEVRYNINATKGFDNGYDGERFTGVANSLDVFTQLLDNSIGKNYQIQSLPNTDLESMIIPVGILAKSGDEITFTAEALNLPNDLKVFLEDRENGSFTRLDDGSFYKVSLVGDLSDVGRFYLHTAQSALSTADALLENVNIYKNGSNSLKIVGLQQGKTSIKIFNILGKQVMQTTFKANGANTISLPRLATGVYIVQLTSTKGKLNKKIILE